MNSKFLIASCLVALASTTALAEDTAENNFYVRGDLGYSIGMNSKVSNTTNNNKVKFGNSMIFGGGVGYRFNSNFRTDLTLSYRGAYKLNTKSNSAGNQKSKNNITALVTMVNAYYDIGTYSSLTPYLTGGLGFSNLKSKDFVKNATCFAWAVGTGVAFDLGDGLAADLGYKFQNLGRVKFSDSRKANIYSNDITLGLRYNF